MSDKITSTEVMELLRKVGNGEIVPRLKNPIQTWEYVFCGEVTYILDRWEIEIFNDCGDFDYIHCVRSPDGRYGEFEDWFGPDHEWEQPDDKLYFADPECYQRMIQIFMEAAK